jgi:RNA polymerase sigma factor (sigma-70 family)
MSEATTPSAPASDPASARLLSDDRLALRATRGDRRAFAAIYRRYHQDLYRYCAAILGDPQDAQDALQNTMVKVLRALPGEERRIQLKPWLYRIAHNEAIELLRGHRAAEPIGPELVAPGPEPPEAVELRERLRGLILDLEDLPPRQRGALVMRELSGLSFEQIGAALQTSPAAARQAVYEARLALRRIGEGREMSCDEATRTISDGDGRIVRRRDLRAHLRSCSDCREFRDAITERRRDLASLAPLPASVSIGLLHGILGAGSGGSAGSAIGGAGAGAGKALATSAVLKSAATIAVVAAVGVSAADRGGLIHVGLPGSGNSGTAHRAESASPSGASPHVEATAHRSTSTPTPRGGHEGVQRHAVSAQHLHARSGNPADAGAPAGSQSPSAGQRPHGLPEASNHGQQTAAAHGSTHLPQKEKRHPAHSTAASPQSSSHGSSGNEAGQKTTHPEHPLKPTTPASSAPAPPMSQNAAGDDPAGSGNSHGH